MYGGVKARLLSVMRDPGAQKHRMPLEGVGSFVWKTMIKQPKRSVIILLKLKYKQRILFLGMLIHGISTGSQRHQNSR
jgi:hypothetical protein